MPRLFSQAPLRDHDCSIPPLTSQLFRLGVSSNLLTSFFFKEKEKKTVCEVNQEFDHFLSPSFSSYVLRCQATAGAGTANFARGKPGVTVMLCYVLIWSLHSSGGRAGRRMSYVRCVSCVSPHTSKAVCACVRRRDESPVRRRRINSNFCSPGAQIRNLLKAGIGYSFSLVVRKRRSLQRELEWGYWRNL
jgi:hypothetical protein